MHKYERGGRHSASSYTFKYIRVNVAEKRKRITPQLYDLCLICRFTATAKKKKKKKGIGMSSFLFFFRRVEEVSFPTYTQSSLIVLTWPSGLFDDLKMPPLMCKTRTHSRKNRKKKRGIGTLYGNGMKPNLRFLQIGYSWKKGQENKRG